ncbi:protein NLRC5-like isoform X5 [Cyprinus carpio]|uniref:Protein NLRC5-like isoform X5 n=1 Tax=Cyprinus carpio TaxID=7962 RepID=A0A9Q9XQ61_CYPCA|nr:protein NLRC5-like isoform X5 [Cyprinus carpio]
MFSCSMSEERGKDSPSEMGLSDKQSSVSGGMPNSSEKKTSPTKSVGSGSLVSSSVSVKSDHSRREPLDFSDKKTPSPGSVRSGSLVSSSVSVKSDHSRREPLNFSDKKTPYAGRTLDSDFQTHRNHKNFKDNLLGIFQELESKIINFLKNELEKFRKILQKDNTQGTDFVKDFNENKCSIKEAALDLTLYFLREMKQDYAADTLEDDLIFIHQLKCSLKKKYQCVFEGIAKQGDSTLLKNIYTDLYITQGCREQVNIEHEVRQIEVTSRRHESQEIPVECTKMFEAPEQDKQIRTVLTKGVAGIGKSVSVQKFILDWAEGKENQDISFMFPLPFREMNLKEKEKLSLMDLITQFFPETKGLNLTRRNKFKVLFILDGLDECRLPLNFGGNVTWVDILSPSSLDVLLTNLVKGNLLPSALIWITTRPAAASKIPLDCIDRLTEIRGFSDIQKVEYFKKRFTDENQAKEIIDHVKKSKSLFIMCHIPVFCWISATVFQNILEEKRSNDLTNNEACDSSKTLQESNIEDTPKTLTQMYTHFLRFQIQQSRQKYDEEYTSDVSWDKDAVLLLGKLAFQQLEKNNLIFYDTDLEACGIDASKASVYSGMCTQIFKEERGIIVDTMYCFVHLSIQEFVAALYAHLFLDKNNTSVFAQDSTEQENKNEAMIDLLKTAVDKALESDTGHLDLFLRFLLALSLQSNRRLLRGLLTQQDCNDQDYKEIVQYIKQKLEDNLSPERSINLFYCLNELNDQTLVKEIQNHLSKGSLSSGDLSPAQWSALAFVLLTSEEELEEFELQKFKKSDECLIRLSSVIRTSKRALLNDCNLTDKSCPALATLLGSDTSLKELNINNNNLQDSGVKEICSGLKTLKCELEILRLSNCSINEEGYKALASALRSNPSHLIELDLTRNNPGQSGVKELIDLLQDGHCTLKTIRFLKSPAAQEACDHLTEVLGKNPLLLKELDLSENKLGKPYWEELSALLMDSHSKVEKIILNNCKLKEKSCSALASVLSSKTILKEVNLNNSHLPDSGVKEICEGLKNPVCELKILKLSDCSINEEGYKALASALRSNPSHLIELDLTGNDPGQSGVKDLIDLLHDPNCQLKTLRLLQNPSAVEACQYVTEVVGENPLLLRELNLSKHELRDEQVNQIAALLQDKHCKLEKLMMHDCGITEKNCSALASVLRSNTSLKELDISKNNLQDSGVKKLQNGLENTNCTLKKLRLSGCCITEEGYKALASALSSNPSHLIELDLTGNDPGQSGVKELNDLLQDPNCQLKTLRFLGPAADEACQYVTGIVDKSPLLLSELNLSECELGDTRVNQIAALLHDKHCKLKKLTLNNNRISAEGFATLTSALNSNPSNLIELDLSGNKVGNSGIQKICPLLKNPQCRLKTLKLSSCSITEEGYKALAVALRSNTSHLIELDLTGNDPGHSGVKELTDLLQEGCCTFKTIRYLKSPAAEEMCQYFTEVLGKSPLLLKELDLSEDKLEDLDWEKLSALLIDSHSKVEKILLNNCKLTQKSCSVLATVLSSKTILKEMSLNNSLLLDSGVKEICEGLKNPVCELKILKLSDCCITEEGYKALASALRSNPSHLIELDLTGNDPGQSGVKELTDLQQDPNCQLKTLRFLRSSAADEACQYVTGIVGKNPLLLRELNLSECELGDMRVNQIAALLQDKHCTLNTLTLCECSITEKQCLILTSALKSNPSHLRELNLSGNKIKNTGVMHICDLLNDFHCKLKRLRLRYCDMTVEGCSAVTSALKSNPSHLRELDLSGNNLKNTRQKTQLYDVLKDSHCKMKQMRFTSCDMKDEDCSVLTSALKSNPSYLRELNLSGNVLGKLGVTNLKDVLMNPQCKLEKLDLCDCSITEKLCQILTSALKSNPSHLRELNLSGNQLGDSVIENLGLLLGSSQCKLEKLHLCGCKITEKHCNILTPSLCLNLSHLRELDLSQNKIENKGLKILCEILNNSRCQLKRLSLNDCGITDVAHLTQSLAKTKALTFLKELDLSNNTIRYSKNQLIDLLQDSNCNLSLEKEHWLSWSAGANIISSIGGWLTRSKVQEKPLKSTEQENSLSDEESSEGFHYSTVINAAQEEPVKSTEQETSPSDEESSEGFHYSTVINAAQEEPVKSTEQETSPSDEESSEGETEKGDEASECSNVVNWLDISP